MEISPREDATRLITLDGKFILKHWAELYANSLFLVRPKALIERRFPQMVWPEQFPVLENIKNEWYSPTPSNYEFARLIISDIRRKSWPGEEQTRMDENSRPYKPTTETSIVMEIEENQHGDYSIHATISATACFSSLEYERHLLFTNPSRRPVYYTKLYKGYRCIKREDEPQTVAAYLRRPESVCVENGVTLSHISRCKEWG